LTADDCCYGDQNTWNTFPGSELNITEYLLSNMNTEQQN
jgi:hypothetical protein